MCDEVVGLAHQTGATNRLGGDEAALRGLHDSAVAFVNLYAPEHLQIATRDPYATMLMIRNAGEILVGQDTPFSAGNYALAQDRITFSDTKACGSTDGVYRIQAASKDHLILSEPDDACSARRAALTSDPFIYAQPDFS